MLILSPDKNARHVPYVRSGEGGQSLLYTWYVTPDLRYDYYKREQDKKGEHNKWDGEKKKRSSNPVPPGTWYVVGSVFSFYSILQYLGCWCTYVVPVVPSVVFFTSNRFCTRGHTAHPASCRFFLLFIEKYKVPLREEARGVAQERNEKHPA